MNATELIISKHDKRAIKVSNNLIRCQMRGNALEWKDCTHHQPWIITKTLISLSLQIVSRFRNPKWVAAKQLSNILLISATKCNNFVIQKKHDFL